MSSRADRQAGFTLLELLIALAIFAVLSSLAYGSLRSALFNREQSQQRTEQLARLQMAFLFISRDLEQVVNRPVRNTYGDIQPALFTPQQTYRLEFTRAGWNNPARTRRSTLQRVAYSVDEGELIRHSWWMLDRTDEKPALSQPLLDGVKEIELRFLDNKNKWNKEWPPLNMDEETKPPPLPLAIEITLELQEWGRIRRLFRLPAEAETVPPVARRSQPPG